MMQWFRISLRNAWLARPDGTFWHKLNEKPPVQLSGERRRADGSIRYGIGQAALLRPSPNRRPPELTPA